MKRHVREVKPVPDGYHTVTPYLACAEAAQAIAFYKKAFGAKELLCIPGPGGKIGHAELRIGDSRVMLADEYREGFRSLTRGGSPVHLHIYMPRVDKVLERAVAAPRWCSRSKTRSGTSPASRGRPASRAQEARQKMMEHRGG